MAEVGRLKLKYRPFLVRELAIGQTPERNYAELPNVSVNYCMERNYKHRVVGALLEHKLLDKGAVLVDGVANLKSLAEKIDTMEKRAPSFMMVLTGTGAYACRSKDGVYAVPIGCLKD